MDRGPREATCSWDGFCWVKPQPTGNTLRAVWGSAPNNVWAAGEPGQLLHWDGTHVSVHAMNWDVRGLWGSSNDALWAVGNAILRWNGEAWTVVKNDVGALTDIHGTSATEVWAVGARGALWRWNGEAWIAQDSGTSNDLSAVWVQSTTDVWVAGARGTLRHWNGASWTDHSRPINVLGQPSFEDLWARGPNEVWTVGVGDNDAHTANLRWNGSNWAAAPSSHSSRALHAIWGAGERVHAGGSDVLVRWTGSVWEPDEAPPGSLQTLVGPWLGMHGAGAFVWAVGPRGAFALRDDASGWRSLSAPNRELVLREHFTPPGTTELWGLSGRSVQRWDEQGFRGYVGEESNQEAFTERDVVLGRRTLWGSSERDVWVMGCELNLGRCQASLGFHWDGNAWSEHTVNLPAGAYVTALWGSGPTDVWGVGCKQLSVTNACEEALGLHWNGQEWTQHRVPAGYELLAIHGTGPNDVWAGGKGGVVHWNGREWGAQRAETGQGLSDLWAVGLDDVWGIWDGQLQRWNGVSWNVVERPGEAPLRRIEGRSASEVYAVGERGTVLRWDGAHWSALSSGTTASLDALSVGADAIWVGDFNLLLRRERR